MELGEINRTLDEGKGFSGSLDGAFNSVSYTLKADNQEQQNYGLFSKLEGASVSNLKLKNASVTVDSKASEVYAGALSGRIMDSKVENVEVEGFDIQTKYNSPVTIYTGALAGILEKGFGQSEIRNVYGDFSESSIKRFTSHDYYVKGSLSSLNEAKTSLSGYIGTDSTQNTSIFGENRAQKNYTEDYSKPGSQYVKRGSGYSNIGFYAPFFVDEDIETVYSSDNPQSYEYSSFTDNPYFKTGNYVDVAYDYEGEISNPTLYTHNYASKADGTEFYFVKNSEVSASVPHYVKVTDPSVIVPPAEETAYHGGGLNLNNPSKSGLFLDGNDGFFHEEEYDRKHYVASLSFMDRLKSPREKISRRLIASLNLDNEPLGKAKTYAYKRSEEASIKQG